MGGGGTSGYAAGTFGLKNCAQCLFVSPELGEGEGRKKIRIDFDSLESRRMAERGTVWTQPWKKKLATHRRHTEE